jgi:hypothetical protein
MVVGPYHDYSTSALRDLRGDFASSRGQLEDQRSDYLIQGAFHGDQLRDLDVLIEDLVHQLAAIDQELLTRERERSPADASGPRAVTPHRVCAWTHSPRLTCGNPKPHFRGKTAPAAVRRPH